MMDEMFGLRFTADYLDESPVNSMPAVLEHQLLVSPATASFRDRIPIFSASSAISDTASIQMSTGSDDEVFSTTRAKIASHPLYPKLLEAYIDFQKVGAPSDIANLIDEIHKEKEICRRSAFSTCLGDDPELDEFMEAFCLVLAKCKSDLATPFNEANTFLNNMEIQLSNLCIGASRSSVTDEAVGSSEEELSAGEIDVKECYRPAREDRELKDKLLRRYSGYISSLKHGFSNNKKKGKLPKEAREILLDWWSIHHKWPYPTEIDKMALAESTGLEQKQINNWFINQRKRHWKPTDHNMQSIYGSFFND